MLRIFLAGATGVIGRNLIPLLLKNGHRVTGTSRTTEGVRTLNVLGADAMIVDVFDRDALDEAMLTSAPNVVIHQLTDLAGGTDLQSLVRNARLRREGTKNLMDAARKTRVTRIIAQSIAWAYAPRTPPYSETDPLDAAAQGPRGVSVRDGVVPLEAAVLQPDDLDGIVLRYGQLYGPGTWTQTPTGSSPVHVEAAAYAASLAVDRGSRGVYNIADSGGEVVIDKALRELRWSPDFRCRGDSDGN